MHQLFMITIECLTSIITIANLNLLDNKKKWSSAPTIKNEAQPKSHKSREI